jgi:arylsulfatase A-like enzyme
MLQIFSSKRFQFPSPEIPFFVLGLLALYTVCSCGRDDRAPDRPNIILIISDDQGWTDYGFMRHEHIETPNIDRLAQEGMTFSRGYTTAPLCRPALASLATGLYPHQHRLVGNDPVFEFPAKERWSGEWRQQRARINEKLVADFEKLPTLMDILGEAGYVTLQTGKWWEGNPSTGGFSEGMSHGNPSRGGRHGDEGLKIGREGLAEIYNFIGTTRREGKPFFIWYAPFLPHAPHTPPDSLKKKYSPQAPSGPVANYWAMCEWLDVTCGQLMDFIEKEDLAENTLFIYVTDNGWIQDPELPNRFAPRSKREPYDMGIRTPIMFRWKGAIDPAMDDVTPISIIDVATTVLGICGLEKEANMQGINVLDGKQREGREAIFAESYSHDFSTVDSSLEFRIIVTNPWKLILPDPVNRPDKSPELYNLEVDSLERNNLVYQHPDIVERLTGEIESWWNGN